ncbi:GNAT family N-acetyltransferase [Intrasporangium calvum]|uniref:GNAT family N-acetyltransferase n=1 Tax=Intrasporangium calvum TaxID=53358 RepID=A0ABT5GD26_9MICO|nr:GNAT family N-acetyltransferase [Intrasporangium calvum]MDC5696124.1 GNAT family N-acetyltransferase [Intrasporangium calvum]
MRDLRPLTVDRVADLAGDSALCTFWQTVPRNGAVVTREPVDLLADWVREVTADWGPPGRVAYVDGRPAGNVLIAPARHVPRLAAFPTAPSDPSTLMLLTVRVNADLQGRGLRKVLVQGAVKEALQHRARSIDVIGARPTAVRRHPCVLEAAFLEQVGFRVARDHPAYPRLRLDLRTVVTVREEVAAAVSRVLAKVPGVRPVPDTHPDGATRARSVEGP